MVKKYKLMRVPMEAVRGFEQKQAKMIKNVQRWTGKIIKIPMTQVMKVVATNPSDISEGQIIKVVKKKIRRVEL